MAQKTAVEWFFDKIKSHFEYDGDVFETVCFTFAIAKQMEKKQIENAFNQGFSMLQWDKSKENKAEQYYNENFKSE